MSTITLPAIPTGRKVARKEGSDKTEVAMDLEAIRARRARLEAMTQAKRFPTPNTRPPAAPSSASKIRRKHSSSPPTSDNSQQRPPTRSVKLQPLSKISPDRNALDKHQTEDPLLKKNSSLLGSIGSVGSREKDRDSGAENQKTSATRAVDPKPTRAADPKPTVARASDPKPSVIRAEDPKSSASRMTDPKPSATRAEDSKPSATREADLWPSGARAENFKPSTTRATPVPAKTSVTPLKPPEPEPEEEEPDEENEPENKRKDSEQSEEEEDEESDKENDKRKADDEEVNTGEKSGPRQGDEVQEKPGENWSQNPEFQTALRQLKSLREDEQLLGATTARQQLSVTLHPPIQNYIDEGAVPLLISLLDKNHNPSLQFQALWALTNIASGSSNQTFAVIDAGGIPPIQRLLSSTNPEIADQAVWAMGNMAGDGPYTRNIVVSSGSIPMLYKLVPKLTSVSARRNMAWTFSNLLRHKPYAMGEEEWGMCYKALKHYLLADDPEAKLDAAWGIAFASDGDNVAIERVIDLQVLPHVSDMLYSENKQHVKVALRIVGNIVSGDDEQTDAVVRAGIVPRLVTLLSRTDFVSRPILKEAAWALSNVMAGNSKQIQAAIDANALPHLVTLLSTENIPQEVSKEVAWCLSNCTSDGTPRQIDELVTVGALRAMFTYLKKDLEGMNIVAVVLEACTNILKKTTKLDMIRANLDTNEVNEVLAQYGHLKEAKTLKGLVDELGLSDRKSE